MFNPFKKKRPEGPMPMEGPIGPPVPAEPVGPPPSGRIIPTDEVRALSSRGVPEPDIIMKLRRDGYSNRDIDQAMKEALRSRVSEGAGPPAYGGRTLGGPPEDLPEGEDIPRGLRYPSYEAMEGPELPPPPYEEAPQAEFPESPTGDDFLRPPERVSRRRPVKRIDRREIEELAEVIVEERMRLMGERFKTIDAQFHQINRKVDAISGEINRIRSEKSGEVKGIEEKIEGYFKNIDSLNGRIESMEKALRDSLAPMLESLRSLSDLVKSMREKKE